VFSHINTWLQTCITIDSSERLILTAKRSCPRSAETRYQQTRHSWPLICMDDCLTWLPTHRPSNGRPSGPPAVTRQTTPDLPRKLPRMGSLQRHTTITKSRAPKSDGIVALWHCEATYLVSSNIQSFVRACFLERSGIFHGKIFVTFAKEFHSQTFFTGSLLQ